MLLLIGEGGTIAIRDETILAIMNENLPVWLGWTLCIGGLAAYALVTFRTMRKRRRAGLQGEPMSLWVIKTVTLSVGPDRGDGVPQRRAQPEPRAHLAQGRADGGRGPGRAAGDPDSSCSRTAWGSHVYAVGGNAEAARRAGINVFRVRLSCFVMCSTMAAVAGILLASRTNSVSPSTGGRSPCCSPWARPSSAAPASSVARAGWSTPCSAAS